MALVVSLLPAVLLLSPTMHPSCASLAGVRSSGMWHNREHADDSDHTDRTCLTLNSDNAASRDTFGNFCVQRCHDLRSGRSSSNSRSFS